MVRARIVGMSTEKLLANLRVLGSALQLVANLSLLGACAIPGGLLVEQAFLRFGAVGAAAALPFSYAAWGVAFCAFLIVFKRVTFSTVRAGTYPFFSLTTVRWVFFGCLVEIANAMFLRWVIGTDFMVWWFRLLGAKIGARVTINTTHVGDWDLLEIGDDVFLASEAKVLAHVGEMGKLKLVPTRIGNRCTVGLGTTIFAGTTMHDGAVLGALSLAPKDSVFEADTIYGGVPAKMIRRRGASDGSALEEAARKAA
jgi:acetyltransferase-like isoleucine patch superfamily enzyme